MIGHLGAEIGFRSFHRNWWKYAQPPIILTSAYILACRAVTSSRYSTGGTPPIKAEQPGLCSHLGSAWERGNTSMRIWTRAPQPVQEEVSSWRFRRAQTVSGPPTFSRSDDISSGAEISTPTKILSSAYISARRQHLVNSPTFWESANIFQIRLFFCKAPTFSQSAYFSEKPQYFVDLLNFVTASFCVYFQYLFMLIYFSMRCNFWRNCFNLRFKIDIVVEIIWSIVIIINFVLTL